MIFVTVGTHEQQQNLLIETIDRLVGEGVIKDTVFAQTGYCSYRPKFILHSQFYDFEQMQRFADDADIIITHGGPSSFLMALERGKVPIVMPRRQERGEHVNNHQVNFAHAVKDRYKNIIVADNEEELKEAIVNYKELSHKTEAKLISNNDLFCQNFEKMIESLMKGK